MHSRVTWSIVPWPIVPGTMKGRMESGKAFDSHEITAIKIVMLLGALAHNGSEMRYEI